MHHHLLTKNLAQLKEELHAVSFDDIKGDNTDPDQITSDLSLFDGMNTCIGYADVEWTSDAPEYINGSGTVYGGDTDRSVKLTATFSFQDYPDVFEKICFFVTVKKSHTDKKTVLPSGIPRIFIAGDSTACNYPHSGKNNRFPQTGWGQVLKEQLTGIAVINCARSGRSSKSFLEEENFRLIAENIAPGDFLLIQFAHNDSKEEDPHRYTSPSDGSYQTCLMRYIELAREHGAYPVLCTPITRNLLDDTSLLPYIDAIKQLGETEAVPVLDLYEATHSYLEQNGNAMASLHYMRILPHDRRFSQNTEFTQSQYYESGAIDNTHLNIFGAQFTAECAVKEMKKIHLLKEEHYRK